MLELLNVIDEFRAESDAIDALKAFIQVRRRFTPQYPPVDFALHLKPSSFSAAIRSFVDELSEGGKRAQAVVAGLMDVIYTPDRVSSGRINDPSRHHPGDVVVWSQDPSRSAEKTFEVRDKQVTQTDALIFLRNAADAGAKEAIIVACGNPQDSFDQSALQSQAWLRGIGATVFTDWESLVSQVLLWASESQSRAAALAYSHISVRLQQIEAHPDSLKSWQKLANPEANTASTSR